MFFRRGMAGDDPWLQVKLWLFSLGALLALVGMALENRWLIGGAGLLLGAGVVLRFVPSRHAPDGQDTGGSGSPVTRESLSPEDGPEPR